MVFWSKTDLVPSTKGTPLNQGLSNGVFGIIICAFFIGQVGAQKSAKIKKLRFLSFGGPFRP